MSNDVMNRLWWREDIKGPTKAVAIALADAAWDNGECYPAIKTVALKSGFSERTVQTAIATLEGMGLLRRVFRRDSSTVYMFVLDNMPLIERDRGARKERGLFDSLAGAGAAPGGVQEPHPPVQEPHPPGAGAAPRILNEPSEEPLLFSGSLALPAEPTEDEIIEKVTASWNDLAKKHPGIQACRLPLDDARKDAIKRRSKRTEEGQSVHELWRQFFARIEASPFLQGRVAPRKGSTSAFKLSMTWALKSANFNEIMERRYERSANDRPTTTPDGRTMGTAEQATHLALSRRRASREQRG